MVAVLINSLAGGGAEKVVLTLTKEFVAAGIPVQLILVEREQFYELPKGVKVHYLTEVEKIDGSVKKLFSVYECAQKLKRIVKEENIQWVQSHLIRSNYINVLSQKLGSTHKSQIVNHMLVSFDKKRGYLGKGNLKLYKLLYNKADMIVSISKVMKRDLDTFFQLKNTDRHVVIYNPHDIDTIQHRTKEEPQSFDFDPNKRYIISVGRLVGRKRVDQLIEAYAKVRPDFPNTEVIVLGNGEEMENYQQVANRLSVQDGVHFLGHISNPFAFLSRADVFVLASEDEGLPNIIIESLICGTPVISSDCISGPRETLSPQSDIAIQLTDSMEKAEYGILFPVGHVDLLAESLRTMLNDQELRTSYIQKGYKRAEDFRASKVAQTYISSFELSVEEPI
ncbi:MAG: glycosyltransferase [Bacteroidota bacterium]